MMIQFQAVNFSLKSNVSAFISKRLQKLENYHDHLIKVDVYLKVENTSEKENKMVELRVHVPGEEFLVKKVCKSFEESIDAAAKAIDRLLIKSKEKNRAY
jgi:putative sigma-54 modulation protein